MNVLKSVSVRTVRSVFYPPAYGLLGASCGCIAGFLLAIWIWLASILMKFEVGDAVTWTVLLTVLAGAVGGFLYGLWDAVFEAVE